MFVTNLALFVLLFFILVFVHEFGHFLMAKWMGIRVERFSIGMGPALFKFQRGDTEYRLAILPIGGYVKMTGDEPGKQYSEEERRVGFLPQNPAKKLLVVFGGPAFNLLFPIVVFGVMMMTGVPTIRPIVGLIDAKSPAEVSGFKSGDHVLSVNGEKITRWSQIDPDVEKFSGEKIPVEIERTNLVTGKLEPLTIQAPVDLTESKTKFGEDQKVGRIVGLSPEIDAPEIFIMNPSSVATKEGLKSFDEVREIDGVAITTDEQLQTKLGMLKPGVAHFVINRSGKDLPLNVMIPSGSGSVASRLGISSTELVIGIVEAKSAAAQAGIHPNDLLVAINGTPIKHWEEVSSIVKSSEGKSLRFEWSRDGNKMSAMIAAVKSKIEDPVMGRDNPLSQQADYRIGIGSARKLDPSFRLNRSFNPLEWARRGFGETWSMTSSICVGLFKLFSGKLSLKTLGSPIMIYKVAAGSYRVAGGGYMGWFSFFTTLCMLSITLGLMNLLPIPVLDGGHAVFFLIEAVRGKPVSVKAMEYAMQVGLAILASLMLLVFYNDFHRYELIDKVVHLFR